MFYPDEIVEQVRESNNIVDVIGSYVRLQKRGGSYVGLCPFHNEKTPSFSVSPDKQLYHCFGCGAGGNVFTFVMEYENMSFQEAIVNLADRAGIVLPQVQESEEDKKKRSRKQVILDVNRLAANYYYHRLQSEDGAQARRYLDERKLSQETRVHFGLGCSSKYSNELYRFLKSMDYTDEVLKDSGLIVYDEKYGAHDRFWNRVMFPIMDINSRVIGFGGRVMGDAKPKYLNSPETIIFDKSRNLYGLNYARISRKPYLIICEGYMDVIAMHQAGFTNAVASLGTAFTEQHAQLLKRYAQDVRLAYDSDEAGIRAAQRAIPMLKKAGISARVIHMEPYKDPDEFIKNLGSGEFQKRIDDAESGFMFEISLLEKRYKLSDPEGRASFIKAAAKKLLEFPQELERNVYIESISSRYGLDSDGLSKMVNSFGAALSPEQIDEMSEKTEPVFNETAADTKGKAEKENVIAVSQKLLLTYMIEDPTLFEKYKDEISADDFQDPLFHRAASMAFREYAETGRVTPARIVGSFEEADEQKVIASLFTTKLPNGDDPLTREKTISDVVRNIREYRKNQLLKSSMTMDQIMDAYKAIKKGKK